MKLLSGAVAALAFTLPAFASAQTGGDPVTEDGTTARTNTGRRTVHLAVPDHSKFQGFKMIISSAHVLARSATRADAAGSARSAGVARLLCGTALGCSLLVFAAAPGTAQAQEACGPNTGAPITCAPGEYPNGISYMNIDRPLTLTVPADARIETVANGRHGVYVSGDTPAIDITSRGDITTTGEAAYGLRVDGGSGTVSIDSGLIDTSGDGSAGLFVQTTSGAVTVNSGSITTRGGFTDDFEIAEGLVVFTDTGTIDITSGDVTVSGPYASGIAGVTRNADITIVSGSINSTSEDSITLYADASQGGVITIDSGTIVSLTQGIRANGVEAISITSDQITVNGLSGIGHHGISASSSGGPLLIDSGTVSTTGALSNGIIGTSGGTVTIVSDAATTSGAGSAGIRATGAAGVDIVSGSVTTTGGVHDLRGTLYYSRGIDASGAGDITIDSGSVSTTGDGADGIRASSPTGDITVSSDSITTTGEAAYGLRVNGGSGTVSIDSGLIDTSGDGSAGLYVTTTSGAVTVNSDSITTRGGGTEDFEHFAEGLAVFTDTGTIDITSGDVTVGGLYVSGVVGVTRDADINIVSGSINSTSEGSSTLYARAAEGGTITIDSGTIVSRNQGIAADGVERVSVTSDQITISDSGEVGHHGIFARSSGGPLLIDSGTVSTAGSRGMGILALSGGAVTIISDAATTSGAGSMGIRAEGAAGIDIVSGTVITTGGVHDQAGTLYYSRGIDASGAGDITIDSGSVSTTGDGADGIRASSPTGDITIVSDSITTTGEAAYGLRVDGGSGTVSIDSGLIDTSGDGSAGLFVQTTSGAVTVNSGSITTRGGFTDDFEIAEGLVVFTDTGAIDITSGDVTVSGPYASAIAGVTRNADITIVSGTINSTSEDSITLYADASQGGVITIDSGTIVSLTQGIRTNGVEAISITSDQITVNGLNGIGHHGISASSSGGPLLIDSGTVSTTGALSNGIGTSGGTVTIISDAATTSGAGSAGIRATGAAGVDIVSGSVSTTGGVHDQRGTLYYSRGIDASGAGEITIDSGSVSTTGDGADGIRASSPTGNITVSSNSITTTGEAAYGLRVDSGSGDAVISSMTLSTSGTDAHGILASAEASLIINTGDISVSGVGAAGVAVTAADSLALNVTGDVSSTTGYGAWIEIAGAAEVNVGQGSSLSGDVGLYLDSEQSSTINILGEIVGTGGLALQVNGAAVTINNNSNTIIGGISLTDEADTFNNNGTWAAYGASDFGEGDDIIINTGVFTITGAGAISIAGLETFDNRGAIDLRNGQLGDAVDLGSAAYIGGPGASLLVDVDFATGESDSLAVGSAAGTTSVVVNDISTTAGFSPGFNFIYSETPLTGLEFAIDPDSIENGFVDLNLTFDPATNSYILQALPSGDSVSMLRAGAAAQDYSAKSSEAWNGRMEDFRDSVWAGAGREGTTEAWGQLLIGERKLEQIGEFDLLGTLTTRDISSNANWRGFQMGVDRVYGSGRSSTIVGATAGFMDYEMGFVADNNSFDLTGFNVGAYAAWSMGPLVVSGLAKYDQFKLDANLFELGDRGELDGSSLSAAAEAAYRVDAGNLFVEPIAGLEWTQVALDQLQLAGATADFDDATSLRGKIGLRIGTRTQSGAFNLVPSIGVFAIEEFDGENVMQFSLGSTSYQLVDQPYDTHGRVDLGLSVTGPAGLQAFGKAEIDFGDGAEGVTWRLGARWSW